MHVCNAIFVKLIDRNPNQLRECGRQIEIEIYFQMKFEQWNKIQHSTNKYENYLNILRVHVLIWFCSWLRCFRVGFAYTLFFYPFEYFHFVPTKFCVDQNGKWITINGRTALVQIKRLIVAVGRQTTWSEEEAMKAPKSKYCLLSYPANVYYI